MSPLSALVVMMAARVLGSVPLLALGIFLLFGPFDLVDFTHSTVTALAFDLLLCLIFFVQHSGMVRASFHNWLARIVPRYYNAAIYAMASGITLSLLLIFWQSTEGLLICAGGPNRWLMRGLFGIGCLGFLWGARALGSLDASGIRPIKARLRGIKVKTQPFTIRGPYRWVRHPLYTCTLILLWSFPDLSSDRLLLNISWTLWIIVATRWEERDLVRTFGQDYVEYQEQVPMLIPSRWRPISGGR